ncbi:glycosyltransferase family 2 protein [Mariprofundus ferrooxydans]|nr:glycosyltransferase family 2 protein [Mariprofundus ferrooxydans]
MSLPRISVITAVYNAKDTISDSLDSVMAQTGVDIELIIVNGASDDGTSELLESRRGDFSVYLNEPDNGIYDALNKGVSRASGDVVGFLHADDVYASTQVLARIAAAFADPSVDAVYGDLTYIGRNSEKVIRYWQAGDFSERQLMHGWMPPHPTFYVRREVYERFGTFDTSFRIAADYDCMLRFLGQAKIKCAYIPDVLVKMRVGGASNRSLSNIIRKTAEDYRALKGNGVGGVKALLWKNLSKLPQFIKRDGA